MLLHWNMVGDQYVYLSYLIAVNEIGGYSLYKKNE